MLGGFSLQNTNTWAVPCQRGKEILFLHQRQGWRIDVSQYRYIVIQFGQYRDIMYLVASVRLSDLSRLNKTPLYRLICHIGNSFQSVYR